MAEIFARDDPFGENSPLSEANLLVREGSPIFTSDFFGETASQNKYEIAEVLTSRGVSRVMLFSTAIIKAEWEANAPLREAMAIKRERLRAMRTKQAAERAGKQRST